MWSQLVQWLARRLRFPHLFLLTLGLFLFDLVVPDFLPLVDETLLALTTLLLGSWRKREEIGEKPPIKDVTPRA
jgi:hypothetical protein